MPVQFAQGPWLERDKRSGNGLADGEICRVNLVKGATAAANLLGLVLQGAINKRRVTVGVGLGHVDDVAVADGAVEDVRVGRGDVVKDGLVDAKVLGQDGLGRVADPVVNVEGCPVSQVSGIHRLEIPTVDIILYSPHLVKVAVVKDKQVLGLLDSVDRMRNALRKVPDVAVANLLGLVDAVLVDGRHDGLARVQEAPFGLYVSDNHIYPRGQDISKRGNTYNSVPVQLARRPLGEMLLRTGNVVARRQVANDLLTHPAAVEDPRLGVGEAPLEVGHDARVRRLLPEAVGALQVSVIIGAACGC